MKIYFSTQNLIQTFQIQEEIFKQDLDILRESLTRFFETNPPYVVVDLSQATHEVPDSDLQTLVLEIKTLAQSKDISLVVAQSDIESRFAHQNVIEAALEKRARILESKVELREHLRAEALRMAEENERLKKELLDKKQSRNQLEIPHKFGPIIDKLWSDRK